MRQRLFLHRGLLWRGRLALREKFELDPHKLQAVGRHTVPVIIITINICIILVIPEYDEGWLPMDRPEVVND